LPGGSSAGAGWTVRSAASAARGHHQPPVTVHDRQPALQRQGADDAVRAASLARSPVAQSTEFSAKISAQTLTRAYTDAGYFSRNVSRGPGHGGGRAARWIPRAGV